MQGRHSISQRSGFAVCFLPPHPGPSSCWLSLTSSEEGTLKKIMSISPVPMVTFSTRASMTFRLFSEAIVRQLLRHGVALVHHAICVIAERKSANPRESFSLVVPLHGIVKNCPLWRAGAH
jgi:hypothetical protein